MPSSPRTPTRRHKSSTQSSQGINLSFTSQSPQGAQYASGKPSHSRKSSLHSVPSPSTPRPGTSHSRNDDFGSAGGFSSGLDSGNGLGSLADELAEAYSDEEEGEPEEGTSRDPLGEVEEFMNGHAEEREAKVDDGRILHNGVSNSQIPGSAPDTSTPKQPATLKHRRKQSRYNRSLDGDNSDLEETDGVPASLEARLVAIEDLARESIATNDTEADAVIERVAESLKDLGSQSGVETSTTRYVIFVIN